MAPRVPELREAVKQDHQRPGAGLDVVQTDAPTDIRLAVTELRLDSAHKSIVELAVRIRCHLVESAHEQGGSLSVLLIIVGLAIGALAGAAAAMAMARSGNERMREQLDAISVDSRERMRDEMKAISADVLKQTGDSLAQRMADQRRAEEERATGEMATRAEEIKGLVAPSTRSSAGSRARSGASSASASRPRANWRAWCANCTRAWAHCARRPATSSPR